MGSSYFVTYGGNRVTFGGTPGPVAWEFEHPMVVVDPLSNGYITMEFTTPGGDTITLDSQMSSASARVPVGSTASWTAHGYSGDESSHNVLTSLAMQGFSGSSSDVVLGTSLYQYAALTGHGSALLTATGSASAECDTVKFHKMSYGEGSTAYYCTVSASGILPAFTGSWGTDAGRSMWIPEGSHIGYSASSVAGRTYSVDPNLSSMSGASLTYSHRDSGTKSLVTAYVTEARSLRLGSGRYKNVYATGKYPPVPTNITATTVRWQPHIQMTGMSSNLNSGWDNGAFIVGSANANLIYGFATANQLGAAMTSGSVWSYPSGSTYYNWGHNYWSANSAKASAIFSSRRIHSSGTRAITWQILNNTTAGSTAVAKSGTFNSPSTSGSNSTTTQTAAASVTGLNSVSMYTITTRMSYDNQILCNCSGVFTASGQIY